MAIQPYTIIYQPGELLSVEAFAQLPDEPGWHSELIEGRVIKMPPVKDPRHDWIISNLHDALSPYVKARGLGRVTLEQVGYDLTPPGAEARGTVAAPDLAFVRADLLPLMREAQARKEYARLAPDLAVEVVSPSQATPAEMEERAHFWLAAGTRLVWNIWPEAQRVDVWQPDHPMTSLNAPDRLDGLDVIPGFTMSITELFA
jgi:Uma2 family endonuclease